MSPQCPARRPRRGTIATEALLVLPIFVAIVVAMVGFADLLIAEQKLDEASARAARVAALGGSQKQIEAAVRGVLGPERAERAKVHITPLPADCRHDRDGRDERDDRGRDDHDERGGRAPHADRLQLIEIRVELEVRHAAATGFVPLSGSERLVGRTVVHRQ
jgi:hypothetical protein